MIPSVRHTGHRVPDARRDPHVRATGPGARGGHHPVDHRGESGLLAGAAPRSAAAALDTGDGRRHGLGAEQGVEDERQVRRPDGPAHRP
ncbi:hypothetical protein [Streptomyces sp. NPDC003032]